MVEKKRIPIPNISLNFSFFGTSNNPCIILSEPLPMHPLFLTRTIFQESMRKCSSTLFNLPIETLCFGRIGRLLRRQLLAQTLFFAHGFRKKNHWWCAFELARTPKICTLFMIFLCQFSVIFSAFERQLVYSKGGFTLLRDSAPSVSLNFVFI